MFPELPDSLAAFRPVGIDVFAISTDAAEGNVTKQSSGWFMPVSAVASVGPARQAAVGPRFRTQPFSFSSGLTNVTGMRQNR